MEKFHDYDGWIHFLANKKRNKSPNMKMIRANIEKTRLLTANCFHMISRKNWLFRVNFRIAFCRWISGSLYVISDMLRKFIEIK